MERLHESEGRERIHTLPTKGDQEFLREQRPSSYPEVGRVSIKFICGNEWKKTGIWMEEDKGNTYRLKSTPARGRISDQR